MKQYDPVIVRHCPCCRRQMPEERGVRFDFDTGVVSYNGTAVRLSPRVFELFVVLYEARPRVLSRQFLHDRIYGIYLSDDELPELGSITVFLTHLRSSLRPLRDIKIITHKGRGVSMLIEPVTAQRGAKRQAHQKETVS